MEGEEHGQMRFSTLEALCRELHCQPGDLLEFVPAPKPESNPGSVPNQPKE